MTSAQLIDAQESPCAFNRHFVRPNICIPESMGQPTRLNLILTFALLAPNALAQLAPGSAPVLPQNTAGMYDVKNAAAYAARANTMAEITAQNAAANARYNTYQQPQQQNPMIPMLGAAMQAFGGNGQSDSAPSYMSPDGVDYREETGYQRTAATDFMDRLDLPGSYVSKSEGSYRIQQAGVDAAFHFCTQETGLGSCKYKPMGIMGDAAHRARPSCHNVGEAIDIGPFRCDKGQGEYKVSPTDEGFKKVINCLANHPKMEDRFKVLTSNMKADRNVMFDSKFRHTGHMHVQLKCCNMVKGNLTRYPPVRPSSACR